MSVSVSVSVRVRAPSELAVAAVRDGVVQDWQWTVEERALPGGMSGGRRLGARHQVVQELAMSRPEVLHHVVEACVSSLGMHLGAREVLGDVQASLSYDPKAEVYTVDVWAMAMKAPGAEGMTWRPSTPVEAAPRWERGNQRPDVPRVERAL